MKWLLTGANGFLGKIISDVLDQHKIITLGRKNCDIACDIALDVPELPVVDSVIHCAGLAHTVPSTSKESEIFFRVNLGGTLKLLNSLESRIPKHFIFISTVAVYGTTVGRGITENSTFAARDPYGLSKLQAEKAVLEWCEKNQVICTILRLPLIAGPNPPGNLHTMIKAIKRGYYFDIAGGTARKSIVMAQDIAKILPHVAGIGGIYNLTDGYHPAVAELSRLIASQLGRSAPKNIPLVVARALALLGDCLGPNSPITSNKVMKVTSDLTFSDSKARETIGWSPKYVLEEFVISNREEKLVGSSINND